MRASDIIEAFGQRKSAREWAAEVRARGGRLEVKHIASRIERFRWPAERAVSEPVSEEQAAETRRRLARTKIRPGTIRRLAPDRVPTFEDFERLG